MALTGNVELSKDFLNRNINFMVDGNLGSAVLKSIMNRKKEDGEGLRLDLVAAVNAFEDRFMSSEDRTLILMILKSLSKGKNVVQVKKVRTA